MLRLVWAGGLCFAAAAASAAAPAPAAPAGGPPQGLTYEQAVEEGMRRNLDLLAAQYNVPMAEADALTAALLPNPTLLVDTIFTPFGKNWDQSNAGGPHQYDVGIGFPVDLSGKYFASRASARKAVDVAQAAFSDASRQKMRDIRLAYIDVMTFQQQLALSKEKEASLQQLLHVIEGRIGSSARLPLMRLRAQLARDQAVLDRRQREITLRAARTALTVIIGRKESSFEIATPLRDFKMPELPAVDALIAGALADRPDLAALRLSLEKAGLDQSYARRARLDNFQITASYSTQGPIDANPSDPTSKPIPRGNSWDAGVTMPLPFFNFNQGNVRKAGLTIEQTEKLIASLELSVSQEIQGIYDQLALNRGLILDYEARQLPNARKVRDEQQKLVGMGSNSLLDYFDAIGAYATAVSTYYDTVGEYRRGVARLDAACAREVLP